MNAPDGYLTPATGAQFEYTEKKSVFIAALRPVGSEEEARAFIEEKKKEHPDARHNVWAYRLKDGAMRCADDGEPAGTGGAPVLESIKKRDLYGCVIVVTRYFGGILLGTGGLVRAYSFAASGALDLAGRAKVSVYLRASVTAEYGQYGTLTRLMTKYEARDPVPSFGENVKVTFLLPKERFESFERELTEAFSGRLGVDRMEEVPVKN